MIDFIFNELSTQPSASNKREARSCMTDILHIMSLAEENGLSGRVRTLSRFYMTELCNGYDINNWLNDAEQVEMRLFLDFTTGLPFFDEIIEEQKERVTTIDILYQGKRSDSLTASFILDYPLISFYKANWDNSRIECELIEMDDQGDINNRPTYLINISAEIHYGEQTEWIRQRQKAQIKTSLDIWPNKNHLFPNLEFTINVEEHFETLNISEPAFTQIMKKLDNLQQYSKSWEQGGFNRNAVPTKCNPVSGETLASYKKNYTFTRECGKQVLAYWHLYFTPGAGRIYFAAMEDTHSICVCHIGGKLPDVTSRG